MQVGDVEASDGVLMAGGGGIGAGHVAAAIAPHPLVTAAAEGELSFAREDDHADIRVLARPLERVGEFDDGLGPERIAHLGAVDRDLRDPGAGWIPILAGRELVADVLVLGRRLPGDAHGG